MSEKSFLNTTVRLPVDWEATVLWRNDLADNLAPIYPSVFGVGSKELTAAAVNIQKVNATKCCVAAFSARKRCSDKGLLFDEWIRYWIVI